MRHELTIGLIINPYAGIGGAVAMKGSDGKATRDAALAKGAELKAATRAKQALDIIAPFKHKISIITVSGAMGEELCQQMGFDYRTVYQPANVQTEAFDTEQAAEAILENNIDLMVFAGGDGTARNICHVVSDTVPVIGIPAGCKIHSGVYGVTPAATGKVIEKLLKGELVSIGDADVMDIDESLFREGVVKAKAYGEMRVPVELTYVQAVKSGGKESDELVLQDIADFVIEQMEDELFIMGSGSTVNGIMKEMGLDNTLLGVDVIANGELKAADVTAEQLEVLTQQYPCKLVITLIGGQGHIFGRGNQQLSPKVIRQIGKENILVVATKSKLSALEGRPLIADTGDPVLDAELAGPIPIITGYNDHVLYRVASPGVKE